MKRCATANESVLVPPQHDLHNPLRTQFAIPISGECCAVEAKCLDESMVDLNLNRRDHHFHLSGIALMASHGLIYQLYNFVLHQLQNDSLVSACPGQFSGQALANSIWAFGTLGAPRWCISKLTWLHVCIQAWNLVHSSMPSLVLCRKLMLEHRRWPTAFEDLLRFLDG